MSDAHVEVDFFLYQVVEFPDEVLSECGSRHFSRTEAGKKLLRWMKRNQKWMLRDKIQRMQFTREQVLCANEVFPESAVADPIADLEVWEEWRSGWRKFPYPGVYPRLKIWSQKSKTTSKTSIGVIGEIFTGLLAQEFIAPRVVVRPINRWPDFIFLKNDGEHSFVESKASAVLEKDRSPDVRRFSSDLLAEGLGDAVQELTAEPFLRVWLAFTEIVEVTPLRLRIYFLETRAPKIRRRGRKRGVHSTVLQGLAEQLLSTSAALLDDEIKKMSEAAQKRSPEEVKEMRELALKRIRKHALSAVREAIPGSFSQGMREALAAGVTERLSRVLFPQTFNFTRKAEGQRLIEAKKNGAAEGKLACLRSIGAGDVWLMVADLPTDSDDGLETHSIKGLSLSEQLSFANKPWGQIDDLRLWRCGPSVVTLGSKAYEGTPIARARRTKFSEL